MENSVSAAENGGDDETYSYAKNSYYQVRAASSVKEKIEDAIMKIFDVKTLTSTSSTINIADLGCAAGPNTFIFMQNIIDSINLKQKTQSPMSKTLEFQVFFNDLPTNNFNTLFTTLPPEKPYFAVGVPGSFHGRLFPESSIHFVYTSTSFQWMSRVPIELLDEKSGAWNKGRVHYTSASSDVIKAYEGQFGKDMENILNARAKEIVVGGMMVIIMQGIPNGMPYSQTPAGIMYDLMAESFMDMVKEGLVSEDDVDSFNLPFYAASPEEMTKLVEKNGEFSIELMELTNPSPWLTGPINMKEWVYHVRAAMKGMFIKHFKPEIVDQMFDRLLIKLLDNSDQIDSAYRDGIQLFAILKRI